MKKLLIVDDNPLNLFTIKNHLQHLALVTDTASCAADTYALHQHHGYDIILLDYHLPDATGLDIARSINAQNKHSAHKTVLISISADSNPDTEIQLRANGVCQILQKPISKAQLLNALGPYIAGMDMSDANSPDQPRLCPDIALAELKKWLPANKDAAREFVAEFIQVSREGLDIMLHAAREHNLSKIALEAHRLKGPPKAFGMHQLAANLELLQQAAQHNQSDIDIESLLHSLQDSLRDIEQQLKTFLV